MTKCIWMLLLLLVSTAARADYGAAPDKPGPYVGQLNIDRWDVLNYATLALSFTSMALDCKWSADNISAWQVQTYPASTGRKPELYHAHHEADRAVTLAWGTRNPSAEQFWITGAVSAALVGGVFALLPHRWKWLAPSVILPFSLWTNAGNYGLISFKLPM